MYFLEKVVLKGTSHTGTKYTITLHEHPQTLQEGVGGCACRPQEVEYLRSLGIPVYKTDSYDTGYAAPGCFWGMSFNERTWEELNVPDFTTVKNYDHNSEAVNLLNGSDPFGY